MNLQGWSTRGLLLAATVLVVAPAAADAASFTNGDLVVERLSTPSGTPFSNGGTQINLDELSITGTPVQSIALSPAESDSGTATSDGGLSRSTDGKYLVLPAYQANVGTTASVTGSSSNRSVIRVDSTGTVDLTTQLTAASTYTGNNFRSVASTDGLTFYLGGTGSSATTSGVRTATLGATASTPVSVATGTSTNFRQVGIFGNQLFGTSASTGITLAAIGSGAPSTASGQTVTNLPGLPTANVSYYGFYFADLTPGVGYLNTGLDTLYIADSSPAQIEKYIYNGSTWVASGTEAIPGGFGLAGTVTNGTVKLYATFTEGTTAASPFAASTSGVASITDTNAATSTLSGTPTVIASGSSATNFYRGIALAPVASTAAGWNGAHITRAASGRGVEVKWSDGAGDDVVGYSVLRQVAGGQRTTITTKLIKGGSLASRDSYSFYDADGTASDRYYVVAHLISGKTHTYGAFTLKHAAVHIIPAQEINR
jgi:hypothetical protein